MWSRFDDFPHARARRSVLWRTNGNRPHCQTVVMAANLTPVKDTLEALTDIELRALIVASNEVPQIAPALLAWTEGACDWELNRRMGRNYDLQPPDAAMDPREDDVSIQAVYAMRESFASSGFAPAALKFFDALLELLTGAGRKH